MIAALHIALRVLLALIGVFRVFIVCGRDPTLAIWERAVLLFSAVVMLVCAAVLQ